MPPRATRDRAGLAGPAGKVGTAGERGERGKSLVHLANRPLGRGEVERSVLGAADRVVLVAQLVEGFIVDPHVLRELPAAAVLLAKVLRLGS